jgi:transposase/uncharacterized protein (UPF0179 family)
MNSTSDCCPSSLTLDGFDAGPEPTRAAENENGTAKPPKGADEEKRHLRYRRIDREQVRLVKLDIGALVEPDHVVRAIWRLVQPLDLDGYEQPIKAVEGVAGRDTTDVRLLICVWVYAFSRGITSGREIERQMAYEPGLRWLCADEPIGYHTLNDFRSGNEAALKQLFTEVLGTMKADGLIELKRVMQDGTKIKASAGSDSFRGRKSLGEHLEEAGQQVEELMKEEADRSLSARQAAARRQAAEEREQRLARAESNLREIEETRQKNKKKGREPEKARASETDPEARMMKMAGGGVGPAFNAQLVADGAEGIIVAAFVSQAASDTELLNAGMAAVEENFDEKPEQVVADSGYTTCANVVDMQEQQIDFYGSPRESANNGSAAGAQFTAKAFQYNAESDTYTCPAGKTLKHRRQELDAETGRIEHHYRARRADCEGCPLKAQCCPKATKNGRTLRRREEPEAMRTFREKMKTEEARAIYRQRAQRAEFPSAWIKSRFGLRQFRLRGLVKVGMEWIWGCLTFNILQWARLRPEAAQAAR